MKLGSPGFMGAFGDFLTEASFFKTDFGFFDFRWEAAGLQALFGLFNRGLSATDIDILGLLRDLCHNRDFSRCDFGITPEDRHVVRLIAYTVSKLADTQGRKKVTMAGQYPEFTFRAGRDDFIHLLTQQLLFRGHNL
mgnify:CR=1 FL=1